MANHALVEALQSAGCTITRDLKADGNPIVGEVLHNKVKGEVGLGAFKNFKALRTLKPGVMADGPTGFGNGPESDHAIPSAADRPDPEQPVFAAHR